MARSLFADEVVAMETAMKNEGSNRSVDVPCENSEARCRRATRCYGAFTLVELLVVVGVITLLIALLLPALSKARQMAQRIVCASNLRQTFMGFQMYAGDFNGVIPVTRDNGGSIECWQHFLIAGNDTSDHLTGRTYVPQKAALCPSEWFYDSDLATLDSAAGHIGYALFTVDGTSLVIFLRSAFQHLTNITPTWTFVYQKLVQLQAPPSATIMLADSLKGTGNVPRNMVGEFRDQTFNFMGGGIHTLHEDGADGRANVVFYDGHGECLTAAELKHNTATQLKALYDIEGTKVIIP